MAINRQLGSSSSITADLFGSKETISPSASTGIFASIFPLPSTVVSRNLSASEGLALGTIQKQSVTGNEVWSIEGIADNATKYCQAASNDRANTEKNSNFQQRVEPCPLSSSLYYGGQEDMYVQSSSNQNAGSYPILKNGVAADDPYGNNSNGASRGNWWQGSLYY